ncbi:MAG: diguanylate cyclase domain-containing protein [Neptuniibacter sp.]
MLSSLRARIFLLFIGGLSLILMLLLLFLSFEVYKRYNDLYQQQGLNAAAQLGLKTEKLFQLGLYPDELIGYEKLCQETLDSHPGFTYVALVSKQKKILFQAGQLPHDISEEIIRSVSYTDEHHLIKQDLVHPSGIDTAIVIAIDHHYELEEVIGLVTSISAYGFIITIFGLIVVIYFLQNNLVYPISRLVEHIKNTDVIHIQNVRDPLSDRKDEIGLVAKAFNGLISKLALSQGSLLRANSELQALTHSLEMRVEQRTRELTEANIRLDAIAKTDTLTGLGNRLQFIETFQQRFLHAKRHKHNFAVLMIDLDGFKKINDQFGHEAGDLALETIGYRLRTSFRGDDSSFRMGGDEFIFLIEEYSHLEDLRHFIDKLQAQIIEPILYKKVPLTLGVSIGISRLELCTDVEAHVLLSKADIAMYQAKKAGGGYVFA